MQGFNQPTTASVPIRIVSAEGFTSPACAIVELNCELRKRKKFEPTSTARPAPSASSMAFGEVMPLLPSAAGQSLSFMINTGLTSHQIAPVLVRELSTTWSWLGVGTKDISGRRIWCFPKRSQSYGQVDRRSMHCACARYRIVGIGALCRDQRVCLP